MDELLLEIDNNICENMKSISFVKEKRKIFNKMRAKSTISNVKKKIYSASYIINSKPNQKKILSLKYSKANPISSSAKMIGIGLPYNSKKQKSSLTSQTNLSKYNPREELSTSLSTLIKPIPSLLINNSNNNTLSNFYLNSDVNMLDSNNTNYFNSLNNISNIIEKNNIDEKYYFKLTFDNEIKECLNRNSLFFHKKGLSFRDFMEKTRILRKGKIIKHYCQKKAIALKEIKNEELNKMDKIIFIHKQHQKLFYGYFKILNHYLNKLSDIKEEENEKLSKLKFQKNKIIHQIELINNNLVINKDKLKLLKELKKFLFEVKFGNFIPNIPIEIKKNYGFYKDISKEKYEKTKSIFSRRLSFLEKMNEYRRKSCVTIKTKNLKITGSINTNLRMKNYNLPIFDYPEELVNSINKLNDKLYEDMIFYKTSRLSVNSHKNKFKEINQDYNKGYVNFVKEEQNLLNNLNYQKRRNNMLNLKLNELNTSEINKKNSLKKIILKLKNILLKVNSMIKIKNKFNIFYWKSLISNNNNFEDINITISNTYYY